MDERSHFASLLLAAQLGVLSKEQIVAQADKRIAELDQPEYWMIEVALDGYSRELGQLVAAGNDVVYADAIRIVLRAWLDGTIGDERLAACCSELIKLAGCRSRWYADLVWIADEFDLVEQGVFSREDSVKRVREENEKILSTP